MKITAGTRKKALPALLLMTVAMLLLSCLAIPDGETSSLRATAPAAAAERFLTGLENEALQGLTTVKKVYRLPENMTVAPEPDPLGYGYTCDVAEVQAVVESAAGLLEGQSTIWTPDTPFDEEYGIAYYRDESILVIVWHEREGSMVRTFSEIMINDASQFRRKLAGDSYGSGVYKFPTELSLDCNAVLGLSADFYRFQRCGVHVYQRKLYRFDEALDICWVDGKGDLNLTRCHSMTTQEEAEQYIRDHDILFTLSFGPIMVLNGENVTPQFYDQGESTESFPRACLGQVGERHYLAMAVKGSVPVRVAADYMVEKGVERCYALDGGQTGTVVMEGVMLNPSMFGPYHEGQRIQSDIIYFATAVPNGGTKREGM